MNKISRYRENIDSAMKKVKNNIDYFDSFGDVYVVKKINEYLNNIYDEMERLKLFVLPMEEEFINIDETKNNT